MLVVLEKLEDNKQKKVKKEISKRPIFNYFIENDPLRVLNRRQDLLKTIIRDYM